MSEEIIELQRYPKWRQAVQDFLREFRYGDLVTHQWLAEHFGLPVVDAETPMTAIDLQKRQFEWLDAVESFKWELLRDHQVCLQSVRGEGYRWVPPHEQTRVATEAFERDAGRVFRTAAHRLKNVRLSELNDEQRKENVDAVAKLSAVRGMLK